MHDKIITVVAEKEVKANCMSVFKLAKILCDFNNKANKDGAKSTRVYIRASTSPCGTDHRKSLILMAYK